jgi:hypothetical protein
MARRSSVYGDVSQLVGPGNSDREALLSGVPSSRHIGVGTHYIYFNDFLRAAADLDLTNDWTAVDVGTVTINPSTVAVDAIAGGVITMVADGDGGEGNSLQLSGGSFGTAGVTPVAGKTITFEARFAAQTQASLDWFIGLMEESASACVDTNGDMLASVEYVGFHHNTDDDGDGIPVLVLAGGNNTEVTTTPTTTPDAGTDATYRTVGFTLEGTDTITWYVDGAVVGTATAASAFTAPLYITLGQVEGAAASNYLRVDYVLLAVER